MPTYNGWPVQDSSNRHRFAPENDGNDEGYGKDAVNSPFSAAPVEAGCAEPARVQMSCNCVAGSCFQPGTPGCWQGPGTKGT